MALQGAYDVRTIENDHKPPCPFRRARLDGAPTNEADATAKGNTALRFCDTRIPRGFAYYDGMDSTKKNNWFCVHLPQSKILQASNTTFINMFEGEHLAKSSPADCPVHYRQSANGDGMFYYFSPDAARRFPSFVKYWGAYEIPKPDDLEELPRLV